MEESTLSTVLRVAAQRRAQQREANGKKVLTFVDLTTNAPQSPMLKVVCLEDGRIQQSATTRTLGECTSMLTMLEADLDRRREEIERELPHSHRMVDELTAAWNKLEQLRILKQAVANSSVAERYRQMERVVVELLKELQRRHCDEQLGELVAVRVAAKGLRGEIKRLSQEEASASLALASSTGMDFMNELDEMLALPTPTASMKDKRVALCDGDAMVDDGNHEMLALPGIPAPTSVKAKEVAVCDGKPPASRKKKVRFAEFGGSVC